MDIALALLFGLVVGSFLNVVICRLPKSPLLSKKEGISSIAAVVAELGGRSHCPVCHKTLSWTELVPVISFVVQRRRCRGCRGLISWQYPLVEIMTAAAFALITWQFFKGNL